MFAETMPAQGIAMAAFVECALADVDPKDAKAITEALAGDCLIWLRRRRGDVRVFASRPQSIAGLMVASDPAAACLSDAAPLLCEITRALAQRDSAKAIGDFVGAAEARARVAAAGDQLISTVRKHVSRGMTLRAFRDCLWANWAADTLEAIANFEPAFNRTSEVEVVGSEPERPRRRRIPSRLPLRGKIEALVTKAGGTGLTKTALYQSIRPKPSAVELDEVLQTLVESGALNRKSIRASNRYFIS